MQVSEPSEDAIQASSFAQHVYQRCLRSPDDLGDWKRSRAYSDVVAYINNTSTAIQGCRQTDDDFVVSPQMQRLAKMFNWLDRLVCQHHPNGIGIGQGLMSCLVDGDRLEARDSSNSMRHRCHLAFRHWLLQVQEKIFGVLEQQLRPHCKHINELAQYLTRSFGSIKTNNYGPSNELMFVFFLCALFKCGILQSEDTVAAALLLYRRYLELVRRIVLFYRLSPANAASSNAIDERTLLPYLWGSAQLCRAAPFTPLAWQEASMVAEYRDDYMLLSSLEYLEQRSRRDRDGDGDEPLGVHAHQLWCVLSLSSWSQAYAALMRTFIKHVLDDFYIVEHLIFSDIMSFGRQPSECLQSAYLGGSSISQRLLPVDRHASLNTKLFLGFHDPRKSSAHNDDDDDDDDDDVAGVQLLRRPLNYRSNLHVQSKTRSESASIGAVRSTNQSLRSKLSLSQRPSTTSYFSM